MKRIFVTCNGQALRFVLPNRDQNETERQFERICQAGIEELSHAFAYVCMNVGYMVARSDLPMHVPLELGSFYEKPPFNWQQTGEGIWELRIGALLYVARLQEAEDHERALEQPLSA